MADTRRVTSASVLLTWGATLTVLGVGICLFADPAAGGVVTLAGLGMCVIGTHRFGRAGGE